MITSEKASTELSESQIRRALRKDIKVKTKGITRDEARYLVNMYYQMQEYRKSLNLQHGSLIKEGKSGEVISIFGDAMEETESDIKVALTAYVANSKIGQWMTSIVGIGPVIAAGFLAYIDIEKATTAGKIMRYAGLDPTSHWDKGEKRPWNADLKVLCWKLGESFVKVSNNENSFYGKLFKQRKEYEQAKNEAGDYADQAKTALATKKIGKETEAYKYYSIGKLPPAHIHSRAKRYVVKMFISHMHHMWYELELGKQPPVPYVIAHMGHVDFIDPHTVS